MKENPEGESENSALRLHFDGHLRLEFRGAKVVSHSRSTTFQCAEVAVSEVLFADLLGRIRSLATVPT